MKSNSYDAIQTGATGSQRTLRNGIIIFAATCVIGTCGYAFAGWSWLDAVYMVVITIFGVGFGEVRPIEEPWLKFFTMAFILIGCSSLSYVIGGIVQMITEGEVTRIMGTRIRSKEIDQLHDHTIICGYGRVGQMLAIELAEQGHPLIVLDRNPERVERAIGHGFLAVTGDASDDAFLSKVGIFRARTLATVLPDDATNVFITLSARDLCESINIIARAECPSTERKLLRGGATSVVMPAAIGAIRIAQLAAQARCDAETLPEDRYRILDRKERRLHSRPLPEVDDLIAAEVECLAELAKETVHCEDQQILNQIRRENA